MSAYCHYCGTQIDEDDIDYCGQCGPRGDGIIAALREEIGKANDALGVIDHCQIVPLFGVLREELERERMRLAACGIVANANTRESAVEARKMSSEYSSASCQDVARTVDREIALREENARLREDLVLSEQQVRNKFGDAMSFKRRAEKAEAENERLRASLGLYSNPGMDWDQDKGADAREALALASARPAPAQEQGEETRDALRRAIELLEALDYSGGDLDYFKQVYSRALLARKPAEDTEARDMEERMGK